MWLAVALAAFPTGAVPSETPPWVPLLDGVVDLDLRGLLDARVQSHAADQPPVHRARVGLDAALPGDLLVLVQGDVVASPDPRLLDAEVMWKRTRWAIPAIGLGKVPFGRQPLVPRAHLQLPDRALASRTDLEGGVVPYRRLGASLSADLGLLAYAAGMYLGQPGLPPADGGGWLAASRIELRPIGPVELAEGDRDPSHPWYRWPRIALGGSVYYRSDDPVSRIAAGGDATLRILGASMTGEVIWASEEGNRFVGVYGQCGYFVWPGHIEVVGRYGWLNSDVWEASGGVALWLLGGRTRIHFWHHEQSELSSTNLALVAWF